MEVSMMFCGSFMSISEKLLGWFLSPKRQRGFKDVSRKFGYIMQQGTLLDIHGPPNGPFDADFKGPLLKRRLPGSLHGPS